MSRIFVSYKRKDSKQVFSIVEMIRSKLGVDCWYDVDGIETQAQFASKICEAIDNAEVVLFMHSKNHTNIDYENDWTVKELHYAVAKQKKIILIKLDDTKLDNIFLLEYGSKNYIEANDPIQMNKLLNDLSIWLKCGKKDIKKDGSKGFGMFFKILSVLFVVIMLIGLFLLFARNTNHSNTGTKNGHEWVDLGLSVKWATCNVGATLPEEYGDYYAWGETETKDDFTWSTYKLSKGIDSYTTLTKYCNDKRYGNNEFTDNRIILEPNDDVARVKWGNNWRMPTESEVKELIDNCIWRWTTKNGINGYNITSRTTNGTIFLPASGGRNGISLNQNGVMGAYWTSSLNIDNPSTAARLILSSNSHLLNNDGRCYGSTIRPVCTALSTTMPLNTGANDGHEWVDLGLSVKWATCNIGASQPEESGDFYGWGETNTESDYSWPNYRFCMYSHTTLTKYCFNQEYGFKGYKDKRTILDSEDDVSGKNWGGKWRMPTESELQELVDLCNWTWTSQNGVNGYLITSKTNDGSIFLPAGGGYHGKSHNAVNYSGAYWSSSLKASDIPTNACRLVFMQNARYMNGESRCYGSSIRLVLP